MANAFTAEDPPILTAHLLQWGLVPQSLDYPLGPYGPSAT